ncbi:MAG: sigma-70 family RNA polymerase sigma factor [Nanoarchaeota archaeon]|nr:sigma-70 family RNA polymerase sigma factor [Nanoarchaeota archaeon]MBU1632208.1 sigma-70 family RNA polymerase sigma factor [Nanoarchaeota archaeon]MBU1876379.1 sigma-70 family RNA polymerase sigma factor [Nanoarchaeota archaeon]
MRYKPEDRPKRIQEFVDRFIEYARAGNDMREWYVQRKKKGLNTSAKTYFGSYRNALAEAKRQLIESGEEELAGEFDYAKLEEKTRIERKAKEKVRNSSSFTHINVDELYSKTNLKGKIAFVEEDILELFGDNDEITGRDVAKYLKINDDWLTPAQLGVVLGCSEDNIKRYKIYDTPQAVVVLKARKGQRYFINKKYSEEFRLRQSDNRGKIDPNKYYTKTEITKLLGKRSIWVPRHFGPNPNRKARKILGKDALRIVREEDRPDGLYTLTETGQEVGISEYRVRKYVIEGKLHIVGERPILLDNQGINNLAELLQKEKEKFSEWVKVVNPKETYGYLQLQEMELPIWGIFEALREGLITSKRGKRGEARISGTEILRFLKQYNTAYIKIKNEREKESHRRGLWTIPKAAKKAEISRYRARNFMNNGQIVACGENPILLDNDNVEKLEILVAYEGEFLATWIDSIEVGKTYSYSQIYSMNLPIQGIYKAGREGRIKQVKEENGFATHTGEEILKYLKTYNTYNVRRKKKDLHDIIVKSLIDDESMLLTSREVARIKGIDLLEAITLMQKFKGKSLVCLEKGPLRRYLITKEQLEKELTEEEVDEKDITEEKTWVNDARVAEYVLARDKLANIERDVSLRTEIMNMLRHYVNKGNYQYVSVKRKMGAKRFLSIAEEAKKTQNQLRILSGNIINKYTPMIGKMTAKYKEKFSQLDYDDLMQEGMMGMARALEIYDPTKGGFVNHSRRHVIARFNRYRQNQISVIREPSFVQYRKSKIYSLLNKGLSPEEISKSTGISIDVIKNTLKNSKLFIESMQSQKGGNDERTLEETIADTSSKSLDDDVARNELREVIGTYMEELDEKERKIILARFYDERTLEEIGKDFDVSRERIRQIEAQALAKLKMVIPKNLSKDN